MGRITIGPSASFSRSLILDEWTQARDLLEMIRVQTKDESLKQEIDAVLAGTLR